MLRLLPLFIFLVASSPVLSQTLYEPQILILEPGPMVYDKMFDKKVKDINAALQTQASHNKMPAGDELAKRPENVKEMVKAESIFSAKMDLARHVSDYSAQMLIYSFVERFPNLMVILKNTRPIGGIAGLRKLSLEEHLQYVLNYQKIELFKKDGISYAKLKMQLYDNASNKILVDTQYVGDWSNPGLEFSCQDSTLECTVNNAMSQALNDVISVIAANSPALRQQRKLAEDRYAVLANNVIRQNYDKMFLVSIIKPSDSGIALTALYQCLTNENDTKFVAFFMENPSAQDFGKLVKDKKDKNINIISGKSIKDSSFFDIPQTYAYIVKGVKYNGKWFYEKANVTYFESDGPVDGKKAYFNNLQQWDYFQPNSTLPSADFWEGSLFSKIPDRTKDPAWDKYGATIWKREELENRPYIGMYEIVANQLKQGIERDGSMPKQTIQYK